MMLPNHHVGCYNFILQRSIEVMFIGVRKPISLKLDVVLGTPPLKSVQRWLPHNKKSVQSTGAVKPALLWQFFEFSSKCSIG